MPPPPDELVPFKVFGLQRTGTNLIQALMLENFAVRYLTESESGWKHGLPAAAFCHADDSTRFVICVKNPYAWLVSCYRYFRRAEGHDQTAPVEFRRNPAMSFEEFVCRPSYEFDSPVQRWNFMNRCWRMMLPADRTAVVRQEDQLHAQVQVLEAIERRFGLTRKHPELHWTQERIDVNTSSGGEMNREYYLLRQYMVQFSPSLLSNVNRTLDASLMEMLGYVNEDWALEQRQVKDLRLFVRQLTSDGDEAWAVAAGDPYGLRQIQERSPELSVIVDVGAHIGATVLQAKKHWPKAKVVAYEPDIENFRMLRLNTRELEQVRAVPAALTDGADKQVWFGPASESGQWSTSVGVVGPDGDRQVPAVGIDQAVEQIGQVGLLKIGFSQAAIPILTTARQTGVLARIRWICGRLPEIGSSRDQLLQVLEGSHRVVVNASRVGDTYVAEARPGK